MYQDRMVACSNKCVNSFLHILLGCTYYGIGTSVSKDWGTLQGSCASDSNSNLITSGLLSWAAMWRGVWPCCGEYKGQLTMHIPLHFSHCITAMLCTCEAQPIPQHQHDLCYDFIESLCFTGKLCDLQSRRPCAIDRDSLMLAPITLICVVTCIRCVCVEYVIVFLVL